VNRRARYLKRYFPEAMAHPVLDVGCGPGTHLYSFAEGSVGLDGRDLIDRPGYGFAKWDFASDISDTLRRAGKPPAFKYVWTNDVIEHVLSPHDYLLNLRRALQDDGLLFVGLPLVNPIGRPSWTANRKNPLHLFGGFLSQDHINFFTFPTLLHTARYAGFEPVGWYSPLLPGKRPIMTGLEPVTVLALRKVADFQYGPKAYKTLDASGRLKWKELVSTH
jgi:SAM-dependent methyltransferase